MTTILDARRSFKQKFDSKQDVANPIPALMGDGKGNIDVAGQPGQVYIRIGNNEDLGQAFNNRCPLRDNLPVFVGYDPITDPDRRIFQVLSIRVTEYTDAGYAVIPNVMAHHASHEYGGGDDVYVDWRRLLNFRVGNPSAFQVTVDPGVIYRGGAWLQVAAQTLNLVASKPAGISALYVLISLNATGVATATVGTPVGSGLNISNCPAVPSGHIALAAVRLYGTQTAIGDTPSAPDIVDLRFPQVNAAGIAVHNILSATHSDSLVGTVVRGDLIAGNSTPAWSRLAIGGAAGSFLTRNATDPLWSTLTLPNAATIGDILHATGANAIGNLADVAAGSVLVSGGIGVVPAWSASPTLTGLTLSGLTASTIVYSNVGKAITSLANAAGYLYNDGAGALSYVAGPAPAAHKLLGASHDDTVAATPPGRGSLVKGSAANLWEEFSLGGASGSILTRNATDPIWSGFYLVGAALRTYTFPDSNGAVALLSTINVFTGNQSISNDAPVLTLNDTTAAAKSLAVAVDANVADFRESSGASGSLLALDLANNRVGIGTNAPGYKLDVTGNIRASTGIVIPTTVFYDALTDGSGGGYRAGSGSDVLWYRGAADTWRTPDSIQIDAYVGIAATPSTSASLTILPTSTATAGSVYGINDILFTNPGAASSGVFYGYRGGVRSTAGNANNLTGSFRGVESNVQHLGSGTLTNLYGFLTSIAVDVGTVTTAYGLYIDSFSATTGGSFGTKYAIYTVGTETVKFGGGVILGAPTGGDKGAGTLNAAGLYYANGTAGLASQVVALAKLTAGGTNGSITITAGIVTAYTAPT